jgi:hypothetical protein
MHHRHLNHEGLTLAAVDDIIVRGKLSDWIELRAAVRADRDLAGRVLEMCRRRLADMYSSQRYSFWAYYVEKVLSTGMGDVAGIFP